jgi:hypothetical protein
MKFNVGIKTFSISENTRVVFERLDKVRPLQMSFSSFLAYVGEDYLNRHHILNITESGTLPPIMDDIFKWKEKISTMPNEETTQLQARLSQLQNILNYRMRNLLC